MQKGCSYESKTVVRDYRLLHEKFGIIINRVNNNDSIKHVIIRAHHFVRNRSYLLPTYCWQISDHRAPLREPVQPKVKWGEAKVKWEFAEPLLLRQFLMTECQCMYIVITNWRSSKDSASPHFTLGLGVLGYVQKWENYFFALVERAIANYYQPLSAHYQPLLAIAHSR